MVNRKDEKYVNQIKKVVIFAGGQGTRLSEHTGIIPKPLVPIADDPVVVHLMRYFYRMGYTEFILALGYKSDEFKKYFRDYYFRGKSVSFSPYGMKVHEDNAHGEDWTVHLVETGESSNTGLRLHKLREYIGNEPFFLTYGDGLSNVDLHEVERLQLSSNKLATITAVPVQERFGILGVDGAGNVNTFAEKSESKEALINGGFMACSPRLLDEVNEKSEDLAYDVLTRLATEGELGYYPHTGFWKAMDTKKDLDDLNELYVSNPELFRA